MRLTKKKAIEIAIELWTWLAETGSGWKRDWSKWEEYGKMRCDCPLCEYDEQRGGNSTCLHCPYYIEFGLCEGDDSPYTNWRDSARIRARKKYAAEFLEQLKTLRGAK